MRTQPRHRDEGRSDDPLLARARAIYHERRERTAAFGAGLFGEPGWDLLLHLFIAHREGRPVPLSEARVAAAAPETTALRWVARLEGEALIVRNTDPARSGRHHVALTAKAADAMAELLSLGL